MVAVITTASTQLEASIVDATLDLNSLTVSTRNAEVGYSVKRFFFLLIIYLLTLYSFWSHVVVIRSFFFFKYALNESP